jgi:hypothetical protein
MLKVDENQRAAGNQACSLVFSTPLDRPAVWSVQEQEPIYDGTNELNELCKYLFP